MTIDTFVNACLFASKNSDIIAIGGGEPTLHPLFWQFVGIALKYSALSGIKIWLSTNGSRLSDTIALASLAYQGVLEVSLSYDDYHDKSMVDEQVFEEFIDLGRTFDDSRHVHGVITPSATGRAATWGVNYCACEHWVINPNGDVFPCGCRLDCVGNINSSEILGLDWEARHCSRFESPDITYEIIQKP